MKIDVDLSEIFNEDGEEVRGEVEGLIITAVSNKIYASISKKIQTKIDEIVTGEIRAIVKTTLETLMPEILNYEFTETSHYGAPKSPITVKNRILEDISNELKWKDGSYDSDRSTYTKILKNVVEQKMKEFKPLFDKELNSIFVADAMKYAQQELAKKLGITK